MKQAIDFTDKDRAKEQLEGLKANARNDKVRKAIEQKQAYINKPIYKS